MIEVVVRKVINSCFLYKPWFKAGFNESKLLGLPISYFKPVEAGKAYKLLPARGI